jgi:hypothetical protein
VTRLADVASVVRSKNTSPFTYALDIIFRHPADYAAFKSARRIDAKRVAGLYGLPPERVLDVIFFDPACAVKVCLLRDVPSGAPGDRDVYGAQQHAPLLAWEFDRD